MTVRLQKLDPRAVAPRYGSTAAAGADLYAVGDAPLTVAPGETVFIHTGLAVEIPEGYVGLVFARSGLASKQSLRPANCVGVCDSDYRGEYIVALHNDGETAQTVSPGDRIAQLVVLPYLSAEFEEAVKNADNGNETAEDNADNAENAETTIAQE